MIRPLENALTAILFNFNQILFCRKDVPLSDDEAEAEPEDIKKAVNTTTTTTAKTTTTTSTTAASSSSWVHRNLQKNHVHASKASTYSAVERNPLYAGAEKTNNWELSTLTLHYHPSAALFAKTIVDGESVGDYF